MPRTFIRQQSWVGGFILVVGSDVARQGGGRSSSQGRRYVVILLCGTTVLGISRLEIGAVVTAKCIVMKEVPQLARVSRVLATMKSCELRGEGFKDEDVVG
jgi:hypothetical protein